jgi:hypothetical protein
MMDVSLRWMTHTDADHDGKIETTVQQLELPTACVLLVMVVLYGLYWFFSRRSKEAARQSSVSSPGTTGGNVDRGSLPMSSFNVV